VDLLYNLFLQFCNSWQNFDWNSASRGLSAIAVLLVLYCSCIAQSYLSLRRTVNKSWKATTTTSETQWWLSMRQYAPGTKKTWRLHWYDASLVRICGFCTLPLHQNTIDACRYGNLPTWWKYTVDLIWMLENGCGSRQSEFGLEQKLNTSISLWSRRLSRYDIQSQSGARQTYAAVLGQIIFL